MRQLCTFALLTTLVAAVCAAIAVDVLLHLIVKSLVALIGLF
jgi:hypothetical protein